MFVSLYWANINITKKKVPSWYLVIDSFVYSSYQRPITLYWANLNIVILPYYISNDSIFIMLKSSQKFPERSLSHFFNTWLAITENFCDHFPPINFEPIWLYRQKKFIFRLSHHCWCRVKIVARVIESL